MRRRREPADRRTRRVAAACRRSPGRWWSRWRWSTPYRNRILQQRQGSAAGWAGEDQFERADAADLAAVREIEEPARWSVVLALGQGGLDHQLLGLYGRLFVQPAGVILRHPRRQPPGLGIRIAREALDRPGLSQDDGAQRGHGARTVLRIRILQRVCHDFRALGRERLLAAIHAQAEMAGIHAQAEMAGIHQEGCAVGG